MFDERQLNEDSENESQDSADDDVWLGPSVFGE